MNQDAQRAREMIEKVDVHRKKGQAATRAAMKIERSTHYSGAAVSEGKLRIFRRGDPPRQDIRLSPDETQAVAEALRLVAAQYEREATEIEEKIRLA